MIYYEAVKIWVSSKKNSIPKDIGKVTKMCAFSTSLKIAWPEHVYFKLEVGGLGEVGCFFLIKMTLSQSFFFILSYSYWIQLQQGQTKL